MPANPVLVEVTRSDMVESFHRGAYAVVAPDGSVIDGLGDIGRRIVPRSAIKPLQAMVLASCGAVKKFGLKDEHVALACASHSGQSRHVALVGEWLARIGLSEDALECGAQEPSDTESRNALIIGNARPRAIHNNCSGKHAGLLTVARFFGEDTAGYVDIRHPVQKRVLAMLEELVGESLAAASPGVDGCGIPTPGMSLKGIAWAFARVASRRLDGAEVSEAASRIVSAMRRHPELVAGDGRLCTVVAQATGGEALIKVGAEGVYAGMKLTRPVYGFALKIDDGTRRAAEVAMGSIVSKYCSVDAGVNGALADRFHPAVLNAARREVGEIRPVAL